MASPLPPKVKKATKRTNARGVVTASRSRSEMGTVIEEHQRSHEIEDTVECANPAYVGVNQGMTKNMGDFNSVKIGVHVSLPCLPDEDDIRRAYVKATKLVNEFMDEEYEAAVGDDDGRDDD